MSHGRFQNPFQATLTGLRDLFGRQQLADRLTDDLRVDGRTCLVTGASSGLGLAIATELARRGGRVRMVSRSRIPAAGEAVRRATGSTEVEQLRADLSDLRQVHGLADELRDRGETIDVLVDNAGVATPRARRTAQGLDAMFVTNMLSKVLLAHRLLRDGTIPNATFAGNARPGEPKPRMLYVSSDSHRGASAIDWEELGTYYDYGVNKGIHNYSYFKLVLNTFAVELSRRLACGGEVDVAVHVMCPGPVDSEIARDAPPGLALFMKAMFKVFFRKPEVAAGPAVYMSVAPGYGERTGEYLHMWNPKRMDEKCYDAEEGVRLWEHTEGLLREHGAWSWGE
ncbi:SDR family NAD(P)-dependent oxidoreductase [Paraliomyxa miuraensis]|uniref:SDR family NAD(P)-dependent oxidoreductase n=1 Tax=Paraliomyxa miuraensis TaxID=376150 RepID=UPI0022531E9C|nr:SDR family NAD(P)-dependent oxidoreductase [Paraliomyxa miuraensis]MCX4245409.1 SDR family NAD(P)-dependent oxidoreductase [Paraliomyxa miuraensis]